jgi:stearoyl-CoA desaturase (delta-9 desaturase)
MEIVWRNVLIFVYLHCAAIYGFSLPKQTSSVVFGWITGFMVAFGTTVGAHRLFTHRSYKANAKLRALLVFMQTMAVQNSMYEWVRDHRVHHKFTDTNADPHNSERGFFFSHIGWLCCKKHPDVRKFGRKIEMSDLDADSIVMFQHKYYIPLALTCGFVIPIWLTCLMGESFNVAFHGHIYRYLIGLHLVWMINSVAHLWGDKPFDK